MQIELRMVDIAPVPDLRAEDPLATLVQFAPGVGPQRAELLAKLEILTVQDLLFYVPRDLLDYSRISAVHELNDEEAHTVRGEIVDVDIKTGRRPLVAAMIRSDGQYVRMSWFNQPWMFRQLKLGAWGLFTGKPKKYLQRWDFTHPRIQWIDGDDDPQTVGLLPRYGLTDGLRMDELRRITRQAVEKYAAFVVDHLPETFRGSHKLPSLQQAVIALHDPKTAVQFEQAKQRIVFDDLLEFQIGLALRRRNWSHNVNAPRIDVTAKIDARIRRLFPYSLTAGQEHAVKDLTADINTGLVMHRLLQADVGAGKTAIAIYALLASVAAGYQSILLAPTEILVQQHWQNLQEMLSHSRVSRTLLTGSMKTAAKNDALTKIASGEHQLIVGTQALLQTSVKFHNPGMVIIDEQHKFGVMQRSYFSDRGFHPHLLVMTATPIPRSLCMTQYGDLDLTLMKGLPPGRQQIHTSRITSEHLQQKAWDFLKKQLKSGRQMYCVSPRIEEDPASSIKGVEQLHTELKQGPLAEFRVGLLHGQMSQDEQHRVMQAFREHELDVLISTTVIEVGVDIANATLMCVFHAERFGLAQLHQLRGRVGRGMFKGYCFLMCEEASEEAKERLKILEETASGFEVAEADFALRGPGDILGTRQHGQLPLKYADLTENKALVEQTQTIARELVTTGTIDLPEYVPLKLKVMDRFDKLFEISRTG
jgi:ATP-dependent DNA helicase RecG